MASRTFRNINDLNKFLESKIKNTLINEVAVVAKKVEQKNIQATVYDAYDPIVYERRMHQGGLIDDRNMEAKLIGNDTLEIKNITPPNPKKFEPKGHSDVQEGATLSGDLDKLIEGGHGSNGLHYEYVVPGAAYLNPRSFTKNTINDLKENKQHVEAMKIGLRKQGLDIKD
jgi:hypothetical protein